MHSFKFFLNLIFCVISLKTLAQVDSVVATLSMQKAEIQNDKDLAIALNIQSKAHQMLVLPKTAVWCYLSEGPDGRGFFSIQVQRKSNGGYQDIKHVAHMDNPAEVDVDTLRMNEVRQYALNVRLLYRYLKGEYRIRVLSHFSDFNSIKNVYSNWFYFTCSKNIKIE